MCQTVYHQFLRGLSNCTWTSCREGCTAEVYSCYHVIVVYVKGKGTKDDIAAFHNTYASANLAKPDIVRLDGHQQKPQPEEQHPPQTRQINIFNNTSNKKANNSRSNGKSNNNNTPTDNTLRNDYEAISADIIESILGESINSTTAVRKSSPNSTTAPTTTTMKTAATSLTPVQPTATPASAAGKSTNLSKKNGALQFEFHEESQEDALKVEWIIPPSHNLQIYELNNTFIRDLDANLVSMMNQIHQNLESESFNGDEYATQFLQANLSLLGIGALLPNIKGCVYPSEITCAQFIKKYGKAGDSVFPCYISKFNSSTVVTTIDKAAAMRHIAYSFIPLVIASGVFTYLFYRVGLIGSSKRKRQDEEAGSDDESGSHKHLRERNGGLQNGAPPVVRKKMRKKFLPNRDSNKKRRKGKIFTKKSLLNVKQMSIKSPSSSRRTPSMSIGAISSDDGYSGGGAGNYSHNRTSVQLL